MKKSIEGTIWWRTQVLQGYWLVKNTSTIGPPGWRTGTLQAPWLVKNTSTTGPLAGEEQGSWCKGGVGLIFEQKQVVEKVLGNKKKVNDTFMDIEKVSDKQERSREVITLRCEWKAACARLDNGASGRFDGSSTMDLNGSCHSCCMQMMLHRWLSGSKLGKSLWCAGEEWKVNPRVSSIKYETRRRNSRV